jgi:hypothetical protein
MLSRLGFNAAARALKASSYRAMTTGFSKIVASPEEVTGEV